jgi:hypothetical protein
LGASVIWQAQVGYRGNCEVAYVVSIQIFEPSPPTLDLRSLAAGWAIAAQRAREQADRRVVSSRRPLQPEDPGGSAGVRQRSAGGSSCVGGPAAAAGASGRSGSRPNTGNGEAGSEHGYSRRSLVSDPLSMLIHMLNNQNVIEYECRSLIGRPPAVQVSLPQTPTVASPSLPPSLLEL